MQILKEYVIKYALVLCMMPLSYVSYTQTKPLVSLQVKDLTVKFIAFYDSATAVRADHDTRWQLWKKLYDFAAVPPGPTGDSIARDLLDKAYPKYAAVIDSIRTGVPFVKEETQRLAGRIAALLGCKKPVSVILLLYVGAFDDNAYTFAQDGKITTAIAVESSPETRRLLIGHELTHAIHIGMGSFSGGWQRTIGATIVTEGLAMQVAHRLFPSHSIADITEYTKGWFAEASARQKQVLVDILPYLDSEKPEDVFRFTMGKGNAGLEREAYYAGWVVTSYWLRHGMTLAQIAVIPEQQMPKKAAWVIHHLLERSGNSHIL